MKLLSLVDLGWTKLFTTEGYWWLAGFILGLVPGVLLIEYSRFKASTRYFRDTPRDTLEKLAVEAEAKYREALEANMAWVEADRVLKKAEEISAKANLAANQAGDAVTAEKRKFESALAERRLERAKNTADRAANTWRIAESANQAAAKALSDAQEVLQKLEMETKAAGKSDVVCIRARAQNEAAQACVAADEAAAKAATAKATAQSATAEATAAKDRARNSLGDPGAASDAEAKDKRAKETAANAEIATAEAARTAQVASEKFVVLRATYLSPPGLQRATLLKAERIRDDESTAYLRLAMMLTTLCWVAFAICWGGMLNFAAEIKEPQAQTALHLSCAGAYIYVLTLLGRRCFQRDITPSSVLWCCVTLAIGPVLAITLNYIWIGPASPPPNGESSFGPLSDKAIFFFAGLAPRHITAVLQDILRRAALAISGQPTLNLRSVPLQQIRGITPEVEARLEEEGILDVINLAMADPLRLLRNTSYDKFQILTWIDEALLMYTFPQHWQLFENEGITGVMDLAWYIASLPDLDALATRVNLKSESLKKIVQRLAEDAQVQLIWILYDIDNPDEQ